MKENKEYFSDGFIVGFTVAAILFIFIVVTLNTCWKQESIQHGAAHYDSVTGNFEWNK